MRIIECEQGSREWLDCRLGKLTASDSRAIATAGKGLETLCIEKVAERLTGKVDEGFKSPAMQNGNDLETEARNAYELETGNLVTQVGFCKLDEDVGASPDGLVGDDGLVEIKCKTDTVFVRELLSDEIDSGHVWQMQFQLWVTDRKWCDYAVYNPNFPKSLIIKRVNRDDVAIAKIKAGIETGKALIKSYLLKIKTKK
jgi:putative phage-type endonuclease